jgi:hypothetical protein
MAAIELSGFTKTLTSWIINPMIWLLIIAIVLGITFGFLIMRKRRKLMFPAAEIVDLGGQGKTCINFIGKKGAGWFGKKRWLFNLWDYGDEVMRIKDGSIIEEFSEEDFQEVNGTRGVIFYRDPIRRLLFPINKLTVHNKELVTCIAPATYTDTALDIIKAGEDETKDWKEKIMQFLIWAGIIIFSLVAIIVITQMVKNGQENAAKLIVDAGETCMKNAKEVCGQIVSQYAKASGAP